MVDDLTPSEFAMLLLLKVEDREVTNTELKDRYGVNLIGAASAKLNAGGYVTTQQKPRPYRHRLTAKGERALREPLAIDAGQGTVREKAIWAALVALHGQGLRASSRELPPVEPAGSLDERIRAAYHQLAGEPGAYVGLTEIRPLFPDVAKPDLDKALEQMLDAPDVRLEPEVHGHRVDARVKAAAVRIGGEDLHKLAIGLR